MVWLGWAGLVRTPCTNWNPNFAWNLLSCLVPQFLSPMLPCTKMRREHVPLRVGSWEKILSEEHRVFNTTHVYTARLAEMSEGMLHRGECPNQHRTGSPSPVPRLGTAAAKQGESLCATQTQSSWHTPGSDKGTTIPSAALTKASLFPSSPCPDWEKYNCHSTVQWLL